jgi:hypothetical protein
MSHYADLYDSIDVPEISSTAVFRIDDNNGNRFLRNVGIYLIAHPVPLRSVQNLSFFEKRNPILRHRNPQNPSTVSHTPENSVQHKDYRRSHTKRQILKVTAVKTSDLSYLQW